MGKEKDSEVIRVKDDDKKMEISLDTSQYRPDELNVSVANGSITVEGKHEEKAEVEVKWSPGSSSGSTPYQLGPNRRMLFPISPLMEFLLSLQTKQTLQLMSRLIKSNLSNVLRIY